MKRGITALLPFLVPLFVGEDVNLSDSPRSGKLELLTPLHAEGRRTKMKEKKKKVEWRR